MAAPIRGRERRAPAALRSDGSSCREPAKLGVQQGQETVAVRQVGNGQGPRDTEPRVIAANATLQVGIIESRVEVQKLAFGLQSLKPMGASLRDDEHASVARCELLRVPLQEGLGAGAKIDGHVPNPALKAAHE